MKNISPEICRQIGLARRAQGVSQSTLAHELGCKQPAISMFEAGDGTKLSEEVILKLAERFGVSLENKSVEANPLPDATPLPPLTAEEGIIGFCPSVHCFSNVPYVMEGRLYVRPSFGVAAPRFGAKRCAVCGEVLETRCPVCGAPLNAGACCAICGQPYVTCTLSPDIDIATWARTRRAEIADLRALN